MNQARERLLKELGSLGGQIKIYVIEAVHSMADYPYQKDDIGYCLTEDKAKSMVNGIIKDNEDIKRRIDELSSAMSDRGLTDEESQEWYTIEYGMWDDPSYRSIEVIL